MKLTAWGKLAVMRVPCEFCGAKKGERCGRGVNTQTPEEAIESWPDGVHYGPISPRSNPPPWETLRSDMFQKDASVYGLELKMLEALEAD